MRRDMARWLAVCLLGFGIAFGSAPHKKPLSKAPIYVILEDPGDGSGGGG